MHRWLLLVLTMTAFLGVLTACEDNDDDKAGPATQDENQSVQRRAAAGQEDVKTIPIEIRADTVTPRQLDLTASQAVQFEIRNTSGADCTFNLGEYIRGLSVPAGQTVKQSTTLPAQSTQSGSQSNAVQMGCDGDSKRQGIVQVEFKGLVPGGGGNSGGR